LAQLRLGGALDLVAVALVGLAECLLERATGAYGRATTRAGVVRADLGIDHTDELLDRHGARAVVARLVGRAVAGVGAGERGVLGDILGEIAECALDRFGLAVVGRGPVDAGWAHELREQPDRILGAHPIPIAGGGAA